MYLLMQSVFSQQTLTDNPSLARLSRSLSSWSLQTTGTGARPSKKPLSDAKPTALIQKREINMRLINGIYNKTFTSYSLSLKMIDCIGIQANGITSFPLNSAHCQ